MRTSCREADWTEEGALEVAKEAALQDSETEGVAKEAAAKVEEAKGVVRTRLQEFRKHLGGSNGTARR